MTDARCWKLTDQSGREYTSRFLITGIGLLSDPTLPNIKGVRDFEGQAFHTSRWPKDVVSFEGKNVGIIGVGATAIQIVPEVAKTAKNLTVFQRTPNWVSNHFLAYKRQLLTGNRRFHYITPRSMKRRWRKLEKITQRFSRNSMPRG